jgi:GNAT superfamily N-acetyltransferase
MLHRAFSRIGAMGIPCACMNQPAEVTRQRISRGECFVALRGDQIVGTITLYSPDARSDSKHYRNHRVGTLRQLAVDPRFHGRGIGSALLRLAENWALQRGYLWLALDTPEPADHLIDYYRRQGFGIKERLQFADRRYRSVVFSKAVADCTIAPRGRAWRNPVNRADSGRATANACAAPWPVPNSAAANCQDHKRFSIRSPAKKNLAAH